MSLRDIASELNRRGIVTRRGGRWHVSRAADLNAIGVLTQVNRALLAAYCQAYGRWVEAEPKLSETPSILKTPAGNIQQSPWLTIANKQLELMGKFMFELGFTPSSRSRMAIQVPRGPKPWEAEPAVEYIQRKACGDASDIALPSDIEALAKSGVVQATSIAVASGAPSRLQPSRDPHAGRPSKNVVPVVGGWSTALACGRLNDNEYWHHRDRVALSAHDAVPHPRGAAFARRLRARLLRHP